MTEEQSQQQQYDQQNQSDDDGGGRLGRSDEESRTSNLFLFLITIAIFIFYTNLYIEDRASSSSSSQENTITAQTILQQCHNFESSFYEKNYSVCDPDGMIHGTNNSDDEYKGLIQRNIEQIESYYTMRYGGAKLNMALIMKEEITDKLDFFVSDEKCEYLSRTILNSWQAIDNNNENDNNTNDNEIEKHSEKLVILFSKREETICLSCTNGLQTILTPSRMDNMIEQMDSRTWWWNDEDDFVKGVLYCLDTISHYLDVGPPSFFEKFGWYFLLGGYLFLYCFRPALSRLIHTSKQKKREKLMKMDEKEYMEAMALMDQYQCYSCPICLEDYNVRNGGSLPDVEQESDKNEDERMMNYDSFSKKEFLGCDEKPVQLLRCGHSTCQKCWTEWLATGKDSGLCPVCKKDIVTGE